VRNELPETALTGWTFIDNFSFTCPFADLGSDLVLCAGDSIQLGGSINNATFFWQDGSTGHTYTVTQPGTYWVELNYGNCKSSDTVVVTGTSVSALSLGNDTAICKEKTLELTANVDQAAYKWNTGSTSKTCMVNDPGTYWVTVTSGGCSNTDTIAIYEKDCDAGLEMPNVFTPNGDGVNDAFRPTVMKNIAEGSLVICNRWGVQLYAIDDPALGWDGTINGVVCSEGVYFWIAEYTDLFGERQKLTGMLTLLR
jgi:large repetitive protein